MISYIIFVLLNFGLPFTAPPPSINVLTYNIRFDNPKDGLNIWDNRKSYMISLLNIYKPDIFGIQEGLSNQLKYLKEELPKFDYLGVGRDDGKSKGEFSAIFYRKDRFKLLKSSTFWLSDKPDRPSKGWDAALERICTYALFQDSITEKKFWVFNTHFDHIGVTARENSAKLIVKRIAELRINDNYPVILMGDLNSTENTEPVKILKNEFSDAKEITRTAPIGPDATFNDFKPGEPATERIDYIFVEKKFTDVLDYIVIDKSSENRYPSDHFPVFIRLVLL